MTCENCEALKIRRDTYRAEMERCKTLLTDIDRDLRADGVTRDSWARLVSQAVMLSVILGAADALDAVDSEPA